MLARDKDLFEFLGDCPVFYEVMLEGKVRENRVEDGVALGASEQGF